MNRKILSIIICICITIGIMPAVWANTSNDYKTIYLNYAKDADSNYNNKLNGNGTISGLIMLDLNRDEVPELLAVSEVVSYFDEEGNRIPATDREYDNPAYIDQSYIIAKAFSIINGEIVEDSPWNHEMYSETISMPFLPDEDVEVDTEEFCTTVQNREQKDYLVMYEISDRGSSFTALWYDDEEGFGFSREGFDENFFNTYSPVDLPIASIQFYDDTQQKKCTRSEAMEILLNKYENAVNTSAYTSNDKNKVSDWAVAEVNEAKALNLIPVQMLNDNLTENITRAEFAAIAMQLHQAIAGEELNWHGGYIVDIDDNMYQMYIRGAYNFGITNGTGKKDGGVIFSPDLNITREQLATMLCRVVKLNKFEDWISGNDSDFPLDISNTKKFSDDYQISDYANEAVYYMSKHGIIKGVDSIHFAPLDTATKEQAILLALRLYNAFDKLPVTSETDWSTLYTDFILANKNEEFPNINYIGLNDLNFDGVPELILSDSAASAEYTMGVLHIQDGEVKLLYGYSSMAGSTEMLNGDVVFYAGCEDNTLTLRKNVNTGELRYFLLSGNGSNCESFGDTFSFPVNENNEIGLVTETSYEILYDDETYEMTDEFYYVLEEAVSKDEYIKTKEELDTIWVDTGVRTPAMTNGHCNYSHAVELSLEKEDLENFFDLYEKEF